MGNCMFLKNRVHIGKDQRKSNLDEYDKHVAVDFALQSNKQGKFSQIELMASCKNLPNSDPFKMPSTMAVVFVDKKTLLAFQALTSEDLKENDWQEYGRSEVRKNDANPIFIESFYFQSENFEKISLKIEIYLMGNHIQETPLSKLKLIGEQQFKMKELVNQGAFCTKALQNEKKAGMNAQMQQKRTTITLRYEEVEPTSSVVQLTFGIKDFQQRSVLFYIIYRSRDLGEFVPIYTSEKRKNDRLNGIIWKENDFPMKDLCRNDDNRLLKVEIFESMKNLNHRLLGGAEFALKDIIIDDKKSFICYNKKIIAGSLEVIKVQFLNRYTFLDYIHGGCTISLMVAMDFTLKNQPKTETTSLHHYDPIKSEATTPLHPDTNKMPHAARKQNQNQLIQGEGGQAEYENEYQQALRKIISILDYYDTDNFIPFFGFGSKLPPFYNTASQCFAVNGNIFRPEEYGIDGLMKAYKKCLNDVKFHGPSAFAPIIRFASKLVNHQPVTQANQFYQVLIMIVNGYISDMEATIEAVVAASDIPLSIIIIGVGDGPFDNMEVLDADDRPLIDVNGKRQQRDIVQFVPYREFQDSYHDFARQVLEEIPKQIKDFFEKRGIVPKDYKHQQKNLHKDIELLKRNRKLGKGREECPYLTEKRLEFIGELLTLGFDKDDVDMIIKKGLHSLDRNLAVDQLSQIKTNPDLLKAQREEMERILKKRRDDEEIKRKKQEMLNKFDDERDFFKYKLPFLAPADFKPLKKHKKFCKICYDIRIDTIIVPCQHSLFCQECTVHLKDTCPLCGVKIDKVVKIREKYENSPEDKQQQSLHKSRDYKNAKQNNGENFGCLQQRMIEIKSKDQKVQEFLIKKKKKNEESQNGRSKSPSASEIMKSY